MRMPRRLHGFGPQRIEGTHLGLRAAWERVCFGWRARWHLVRTEWTSYDRDAQLWVTEVERWPMKMPDLGRSGGPTAPHAKVTVSLMRYPQLSKLLTSRSYDQSSQQRDGGMLSLTARDGSWWCTLKDPTAALKLVFELDDPLKVWETAEAVLAAEVVPWVTDPFSRPRVKMVRPKSS